MRVLEYLCYGMLVCTITGVVFQPPKGIQIRWHAADADIVTAVGRLPALYVCVCQHFETKTTGHIITKLSTS